MSLRHRVVRAMLGVIHRLLPAVADLYSTVRSPVPQSVQMFGESRPVPEVSGEINK